MKRNRIIYFILLLGSGIFVSFYGGFITYMLFYFMLLLPVFALIYTLYVNIRFKIHQTVGAVKIIKKEAVPYEFILANEDIFTFNSIKVTFHEDKSHIKQDEEMTDHCLAPKSSRKITGTIYGDYRGTYEVGAKSVEIKDFLYLFKVTYPMRSKLKMIVRPRVLPIEKFNLTSFAKDFNNTKFNPKPENETIDAELRKYVKGDSRKLIHWKASARKQELLTKRVTDMEEQEIFVIVDMTKGKETEDAILITEDKIIELALAVTNSFCHARIPVNASYDWGGVQTISIRSRKDFNDFYNICSKVEFGAAVSIQSLVEEIALRHMTDDYLIIITAELTRQLHDRLMHYAGIGKKITFFYIRKTLEDKEKNMLQILSDAGICIYSIWMDENLEELFQTTNE